MNYLQALQYLNSLDRVCLGTDRLARTLKRLGNPERSLKCVHVVGTNGKGSTCAFVAAILGAAGFKTGLFTSPYLECVNESILVDGGEIEDEDFARAVTRVEAAAQGELTKFEVLTAAALGHFAHVGCDIVVLEAGMGGKDDATNAIAAPLVALMTRIGLEHMQALGATVDAIAHNKAGVIKGAPVVVAYQGEDIALCEDGTARSVAKIALNAARQNSDKVIYAEGARLEGDRLVYKNFGTSLGLKGAHQAHNAAAAIECALLLRECGYTIADSHIIEGLSRAFVPARLECIEGKRTYYIDGAHNPQGIAALMEYFGQEIDIIFGVLADKDYAKMIELIAPHAGKVCCMRPDNARALSAEDCAREFLQRGIIACTASNMEDAVRGMGEVVCVCGSLFLAGRARREIVQVIAGGREEF